MTASVSIQQIPVTMTGGTFVRLVALHSEYGVLGFCDVAPKSQEVLWLHTLYVLPEFQGNGVGSTLVTKALEVARQLGDFLFLSFIVRRQDAKLCLFYKKLGFAAVSTDSAGDIVFSKPLQDHVEEALCGQESQRP